MSALSLTINHRTEHLDLAEADDAMRRYWEAKQGGDASARLVLVHDIEVVADDDDDPTTPNGAALSTTPGGQISVVAQERIALHEDWLEEAGFSVPPPLYAPGTRVIDLGDQNFRLARQRVEDLPLFGDAAQAVIDEVRGENRHDVTMDLRSLDMDDGGHLLMQGHRVGLEHEAFRQLCQSAGFGKGTAYLRDLCSPSLRATNVNEQLQTLANRDLVLRTRGSQAGARQAYAVVTPSYAAVDTDVVLEVVADALADARTEMRYDGTGVRATAIWMPDEVVDLAAGDIFKAAVRIETDDRGMGRIKISGAVHRNLCLNLIIVGEGEVQTVNQVHRGDPARILEIVSTGVEKARASVANFLEAWGHARTVKVNPEETLRSWVKDKKLYDGKRRDDEAIVEELLSAWSKEPGPGSDTLAGCVNAVTRAAHETDWWDIDFREELERRASRLVLVPA